jgi:hypothetical protein
MVISVVRAAAEVLLPLVMVVLHVIPQRKMYLLVATLLSSAVAAIDGVRRRLIGLYCHPTVILLVPCQHTTMVLTAQHHQITMLLMDRNR